MSDVAIVGAGIHRSGAIPASPGSRWRPSPRAPALADAGIGWEDVDFASGGSDSARQRRHVRRPCSA